jgi:hypothetical protein
MDPLTPSGADERRTKPNGNGVTTSGMWLKWLVNADDDNANTEDCQNWPEASNRETASLKGNDFPVRVSQGKVTIVGHGNALMATRPTRTADHP